MEHHICETCGGANDVPGTCSTEGCNSKGNELVVCNCDGGVAGHNAPKESEESNDGDE